MADGEQFLSPNSNTWYTLQTQNYFWLTSKGGLHFLRPIVIMADSQDDSGRCIARFGISWTVAQHLDRTMAIRSAVELVLRHD